MGVNLATSYIQVCWLADNRPLPTQRKTIGNKVLSGDLVSLG